MKIEWLGHACFLLETKDGLKIITDPYEPGSYEGAVGYSDINVKADLVTVSHQHFDHNYIKAVPEAQVIDKAGNFKIKGIDIEGIKSFHDKSKGLERGENIIFIFSIDGLRIAHFGDLGDIPDNLEKLRNLDIVLIPVGGTFTINAEEASKLIDLTKPKIAIPMHFKTEKLGFDIDGVDKFIAGKSNLRELNTSLVEVSKDNLPLPTQIVVLKPAR